MSERRPARVRLRLRTRLALAMSALVAGAVALTGWVTLSRVEAAYSREFDARIGSLLDAAEAHYDTLGARTVSRVETLAGALLEDRTLRTLTEKLLIRPDRESAVVLEAAGRLQRISGLDLLQILDDEGRVLTSAQWPERAGFSDRSALDLPEGLPALRRERLPGGEVLAVVARSSPSLAGRRVILIGGMILGAAFLQEVAPGPGEVVMLLDGEGSIPMAAGASDRLAPATAAFSSDLLRPTGPARGAIRPESGAEWAAGGIPLVDASGDRLATLVVAVDPAERIALLRRLRISFLTVGLAGGMLAVAASAWVAARITRPLAQLVGAVDAITAGRADYGFPQPGADETARLVESFSRMHRSLEHQQRRLLAAERVAAWKEVAQRVAHEVKNPLSPIRLAVENMRKARERAPEMFDPIFEEATGNIVEEVDQLERIVTEFSEFARLPAPRPAPCDLDALVDQVLSLHAAEPGLQVRRRRDAPIPPVTLDDEQISRALKNLVGNAVDAMRPAGGGVLEVRTARDGDSAVVELADSGPGFSEAATGRLFEPYFTTKAKGTGLGLPISLRIVSDHGGSLRAENRPGGGARVVLRLPLSGPEPSAGAPESEVP